MIGTKLKEARLEMSISQKQLAGESYLTRSYISMIENGHTVPSKQTLEKLAFILKKPLHYFQEDQTDAVQEVGMVYLDKAQSLFLSGNAEEGIVWLDLLEKLEINDALWARSFLLRIDCWISLKRHSEAYHAYIERQRFIERIKDRILRFDIHMMIAKLYFRMDRFKDAIVHYELANTMVAGLKNLQYKAINTYIYLGTSYNRVGNIQGALHAYRSAFELAKLEGDPEQLGDISMGLGKVYALLQDPRNAKDWTEKCIHYYKHVNQNNYMRALHNLAVIERKFGQLDSSREKLVRCLWYAKNNHKKLFSLCLFELTVYKFMNQQFSQTRLYCKKALENLPSQGYPSLKAEIYRLMGAIFILEHNHTTAYFFTQASAELFRSMPLINEAEITENLVNKNRDEIIEVIQRLV